MYLVGGRPRASRVGVAGLPRRNSPFRRDSLLLRISSGARRREVADCFTCGQAPPLFRPRRAVCCTFGPPRTEMWGHWPHVEGSAVSRRRAPLEVRSNKCTRRNGEFRRGRPATPTRRAPLIRPFYNMMTVTEHSDFESLTFVNKKYRRDKL